MQIRRSWVVVAGGLVAAGAVIGWFLSAPRPLPDSELAALASGDPVAGERVFWASGCASCHAKPGAKDENRKVLAGGLVLKTPFGGFSVPNISPDTTDGIGAWSIADFANAMKRGIAPDGSHYYPAFPYASYARMTDDDIQDLFAYLGTLPVASGKAPESDIPFPFNIRRSLGLWKLLFLHDRPFVSDTVIAQDPVLERGRYLVEGLGHCGECHSPRTLFGAGGMDAARWLGGAASTEGEGRIPNITTGEGGISGWSEADLAYGLQTGFTPDFDSLGSSMAEVVENYSHVSEEDRLAIAAYLKAIPPVAD